MKAMKRSWHVSRPSGQGSRTEHSRSWTPSARTPTAIFPGIPSGIPDTSLSSMPPWLPVLPSKAAFPWKQPITSATSLSSAWTSAAPRKRFKSFWIRWSAHLPHKSAAAEKRRQKKLCLPLSVMVWTIFRIIFTNGSHWTDCAGKSNRRLSGLLFPQPFLQPVPRLFRLYAHRIPEKTFPAQVDPARARSYSFRPWPSRYPARLISLIISSSSSAASSSSSRMT